MDGSDYRPTPTCACSESILMKWSRWAEAGRHFINDDGDDRDLSKNHDREWRRWYRRLHMQALGLFSLTAVHHPRQQNSQRFLNAEALFFFFFLNQWTQETVLTGRLWKPTVMGFYNQLFRSSTKGDIFYICNGSEKATLSKKCTYGRWMSRQSSYRANH